MSFLKNNKKRTSLAVLLIWISLGVDLLIFILNLWRYNFLDDEIPSSRLREAILVDSLYSVINLIFIIVLIISAVTFIQWFRRAYYNLHVKVTPLSYREGWVAGCWFIPLINLYMPYRIMKELYVETDKLLIKNSENYSPVTSYSFIKIWWALWIIYEIVNFTGIFLNSETLNELRIIAYIDISSFILIIPLSIITIQIIKKYSYMESHLILSEK